MNEQSILTKIVDFLLTPTMWAVGLLVAILGCVVWLSIVYVPKWIDSFNINKVERAKIFSESNEKVAKINAESTEKVMGMICSKVDDLSDKIGILASQCSTRFNGKFYDSNFELKQKNEVKS